MGFSRYVRDFTRPNRVLQALCADRDVIPSRRSLQAAVRAAVETLEIRQLLSASFDVTHLSELRQNSQFVDVDGSDVGVAVLDTGIYDQNPDLQQNVTAFYNAVTDRVDTPLVDGSAANAFDLNGHGSHTAGIAASSNPDIGVAYAAKIIAVKVLADPGESQLGGNPITRGLQWVKIHALDLNIKVVNLSVGTAVNINSITSALTRSEISRAIRDLESLGITVVASTGNSYAQYEAPGATYPAAVSTISVANTWADSGKPDDFNTPFGGDGDRYFAIDETASPDRIASTSQRSQLPNQIAAPGQDIYSTWNGFSGDGGDGLHKVNSGTSMAAPFVSGVVALMQDAAKTYGGQYLSDPAQIRQILLDTADTVIDSNVADNQRYDSVTGALLPLSETGLTFKRVNVEKAIERVFQLVTAGNPNPNPDPGTELDTDSVRGRATVVPELNATRKFTYNGSIGTDGQVAVGDNDIDLFRINLQTRGNLTIALSYPAGGVAFPLDGTIRLFNAAGTQIGRADGDSITFDYPTLTTNPASPLSTGVYYVGISAKDNFGYSIVNGSNAQGSTGQGDYTMVLSLSNPDPNGVVQGAVDVDLTTPTESLTDPLGSGRTITVNRLNGLLGSDKPIVGSSDRITVDADVDMYKVLAPDDGNIQVDIEAQSIYGISAADTYIKVYNENLDLIGQNDDKSASDPDSALTITGHRGDIYYIAVTVFGNRSFDARDPYNSRTPNSTPVDKAYDLLLWADNNDVNGTAVAATDLAAGSTISGRIGTDTDRVGDGAAPSKDVDWVTVTAPQDGLLTFDTTGVSGFTPSMSLWEFDATGQQITKLDDDTGAESKLSLRVKQGEKVYVAVTGAGNTDFNWFSVASGAGGDVGSYTLSTTLESPETAKLLVNDSVNQNTPTPIAIGQVINADLGRDGDVVIGSTDVDLYSITPEADVTVRIRTSANTEDDADTVLRLFDSKGKEIALNDNATAAGKGSRLTATLRKGQTYYIGVNGAGPSSNSYDPLTGAGAGSGSVGRYGLVVEQLPPGSASLTFTKDTPGRYTDVNGHKIVLKMTGSGTGQLDIDGSDLSTFQLNVDDSGTDTVISVSGKTSFGNVRINGPLKAFKATGVKLVGDFDCEGSLGGLWLGSADVGSIVSANLLETLRVGSDFGADLSVSGDLGTFKAANDITGGTWNIAGGARSLGASDALAGWVANFGGELGPIKLRTYAGSITAGDFKTISVSRDISAGTLVATFGGITTLSAGSMTGTTVRVTGDIGKVSLGSAADSTIFAGVDDATTDLPTDATAFVADSLIGSFSIKRGPFSNTRIAASRMTTVALKKITTDNAGVRFGLASTAISNFAQDGVRKIRNGKPVVLGPVGDFVVDVLAAATPG